MFLSTLGATLLRNLLTVKGVKSSKNPEQEVKVQLEQVKV